MRVVFFSVCLFLRRGSDFGYRKRVLERGKRARPFWPLSSDVNLSSID